MQPDDSLPEPSEPALSVSGITTHAATGLPVSGVALSWVATLANPLLGKKRTITLGTGISGERGRFEIALGGDGEAIAAYKLLACAGDGTAILVVTSQGVAAKEVPVQPGVDATVTVEVKPKGMGSLPAKKLATLAEFLATNQVRASGDLQRQIAEPRHENPVREWPLAARLKALGDLEKGMKGKGGENGNGKWQLLDLDILSGGDLVGSITDGIAIPDYYPDFSLGKKSNLALYRDYLRGIWVTTGKWMHSRRAFNNVDVSRAVLEQQLNNRLRQNFREWRENPASAAKLLAGILKSALTAPAGTGGYGKAASAIPAKTDQQTEEDYLAALIGLTGNSRTELRNRFRVSFEPQPGEQTTPIQLNVDALRGFLSDSFQGPIDPYNASPDAAEGRSDPIILRNQVGKAPFYLQYEEWLERQKAFHCENLFDVRRTIPYFSPPFRNEFASQWGDKDLDVRASDSTFVENATIQKSAPDEGVAVIPTRIFEFVDKLNGAIWQVDNGDFGGAAAVLRELEAAANQIIARLGKLGFYRSSYTFQSTNYGERTRQVSLSNRAAIDTSTAEGLAALEAYFKAPDFPVYNPFWPTGRPNDNTQMSYVQTMQRNKARTEFPVVCLHWLSYARRVIIPLQNARIAQALGDYAAAARILCQLTGVVVGVAEPETEDPYNDMEPYPALSDDHFRWLHRLSALPYTTSIYYSERTDRRESRYPLDSYSSGKSTGDLLAASSTISPCEWRACKLAQGRAMLDWAEELFRKDDPSSIRRARELYKGVLILHGIDPGIFPAYPKEGEWPMILVPIISNPAISAQVARANHGLYLIAEGLNAYGWRDDMVPILRYRPLKDSSDALAAAAKSSQNEFLSYTARFEQAQLDRMQASLLIKKAQATVKIADEQIAIGQHEVQAAQKQVKEIEKQIEKKQKEIEEKDAFFSQFMDYLSGLKKAAKSLKGDSKGKDKEPEEGDFLPYMETGFWIKSFSSLGAGAGYLAGIGVFFYASYVSMEGMEKEANKRGAELKKLRDTALPAAKAMVVVKQRVLRIANLQKQIAQADLKYARALAAFHRERFLSAETWAKLAALAQQLMSFYVDAGARMGWLAERALAFEQARELSIIRMNYLPRAMRGVTGADMLQADLATLENNRLLGLKLAMPVKHSVSLARAFPLAFGALKATGRCSFFTEEESLRTRYPGLYGARLRAVTVSIASAGASTFRGILRNRGVSSVGTDTDGNEQILLRFPDALPISEFKLERDMHVYGLPNETLMQFEGSGFTTQWDIALYDGEDSLDEIIDLQITFDGFGYYDDDRFVELPENTAPAGGTLIFPASRLNPAGLLAVMTGETRELAIDLDGLAAQPSGGNRAIANIALVCLGTAPSGLTVATQSGQTAAVDFDGNGIAASNAAPFDPSEGASPLNALVGASVDQTITLSLGDGDWSALDDLIVYIEHKME